MAHLLQVGAGSGGMPVLDMLCRDPRDHARHARSSRTSTSRTTSSAICSRRRPSGEPKAVLAERWLKERRPDLEVRMLALRPAAIPQRQADIDEAAAAADIGVCAADNEPAKYHWDALMRRHGKPWTLGEVLSGGIGGFVHWFVPGRPLLRLRRQPSAALRRGGQGAAAGLLPARRPGRRRRPSPPARRRSTPSPLCTPW